MALHNLQVGSAIPCHLHISLYHTAHWLCGKCGLDCSRVIIWPQSWAPAAPRIICRTLTAVLYRGYICDVAVVCWWNVTACTPAETQLVTWLSCRSWRSLSSLVLTDEYKIGRSFLLTLQLKQVVLNTLHQYWTLYHTCLCFGASWVLICISGLIMSKSCNLMIHFDFWRSLADLCYSCIS